MNSQNNIINWDKVTASSPGQPRDSQGEIVFKDKIWVAGGAAGEDYKLNSEVWSIYIPQDWFKINNCGELKNVKRFNSLYSRFSSSW